MLKIYIENNTIYKKAFAEYAVRTWYCKIVGEACCAVFGDFIRASKARFKKGNGQQQKFLKFG
jgi:hypothetical protein